MMLRFIKCDSENIRSVSAQTDKAANARCLANVEYKLGKGYGNIAVSTMFFFALPRLTATRSAVHYWQNKRWSPTSKRWGGNI